MKNHPGWVVIFVALLLLSCGASSEVDSVRPTGVRFTEGDDPRYASTLFDDDLWTESQLGDLPQPDGILWLRTTLDLPRSLAESDQPLALYFAALASHEIYWDGALIGRGGVPASHPAGETPGPLEALYYVPDHLRQAGEHTIAVRTSAHHRHFVPSTGYWTIVAGEYETVMRRRGVGNVLALVSLSGIVIVGLFALAMFMVDRGDRSWILLALLCLVAAGLLIAESWRGLFGYTYNWHLLRLVVVTSLTALVNLTLLLFLLVRFRMSHSKFFVLLALAGMGLALLSPGFDGKAIIMFGVGLSLSLIWAIRATRHYRLTAVPAVVGVGFAILILAVEPWMFGGLGLFLSLDLLLVCLMIAHAMEVRRALRERREAELKSSRLEIELLRKHIQPHFLMNTLTALTEWIEEEPAVATSMIEALAEEFRLLSDISARPLIRLDEELRLCRIHLEIMNRRTGASWVLETADVEPDALIPPAIIHTLVENAITHTAGTYDHLVLRLTHERKGERSDYLFEAPLDGRHEVERGEGTGIRYIRARLSESFGADWRFESGPADGCWRTRMEIPRRSVAEQARGAR